MPFDNGLPIIGAALTADMIALHRDWIFDKQRDLEIQDFSFLKALGQDWNDIAGHLKSLLEGYTGRLGIHGPFWGLMLDNPDPDIRAVCIQRYRQGLDICERLGATQMDVHSPYTTWDYNNFDDHPGSRDALVERVHLTLDPLLTQAKNAGIVLVVENIEDIDPRARVDLVKQFNSPALRVSIDTGHAHYAHGSNGAPPVDYYVEAAGDLLDHVHLQDADGHADRHWQPGEGSVNWRAVFRSLARLTSDPRLVLEVRDEMRLMQGWQHLVALGLAV
jgi:sugar phosphate isomerase/epimerase